MSPDDEPPDPPSRISPNDLTDEQLGRLYRPLPRHEPSFLLGLEGRHVLWAIAIVVVLVLLWLTNG